MSISEYAQTNLETLLLVLEDKEYKFWPVENEFDYGVATTIVVLPDGKNIDVSFTISEIDEMFYIKTSPLIKIEKVDIPSICTALAVINNSVFYGKFQFDIDSLIVSFHFAHYYGSNVVTDGQYAMLISGSLAKITEFYEQISCFTRA